MTIPTRYLLIGFVALFVCSWGAPDAAAYAGTTDLSYADDYLYGYSSTWRDYLDFEYQNPSCIDYILPPGSEDYYCLRYRQLHTWVSVGGTLYSPSAVPFYQDAWTYGYEAWVTYDGSVSEYGAWTVSAAHYLGWDAWDAYCTVESGAQGYYEVCSEFVYYQYTDWVFLGTTDDWVNAQPTMMIPELTYLYFDPPVVTVTPTMAGCYSINFNSNVLYADFTWHQDVEGGGSGGGTEYEWPNGLGGCVQPNDPPWYFGTYYIDSAKASGGSVVIDPNAIVEIRSDYPSSVSITGFNFENENPANDDVSVTTAGPPGFNGLLRVSAQRDGEADVLLFEAVRGIGSHHIAFLPVGGTTMPPGIYTAIKATYGPVQAAPQPIVPSRVDTHNVTVVSWVPGGEPVPNGASQDLQTNLNVSSASCLTVLAAWLSGNPQFLNTPTDRAYANVFLINHSTNSAPPSTLSPGVLQGGDFRMYNVLQWTFRRNASGVVSEGRKLTIPPVLGATPDPCGVIPDQPPAPHPNHGFWGRGSSQNTYFQLSEGRIGTDGQAVNFTINQRTTPWIWTVISFSTVTGGMTHSSMFPAHTVYVSGMNAYTTAPNLSGFVAQDATYQLLPANIP